MTNQTQPNNQIHVHANGRMMTLAAALKIAATITHLEISNQPDLQDIPDLPAATVVRLDNLPGGKSQ